MVLILSVGPGSAASQVRQDVIFESEGAKLSGTLVTPAGSTIKAAVVFVHGSGPQTRSLTIADRFAEKGIAALVYDKRGTGNSEGNYESQQSVSGHNIELLAEDAAVALETLAKQKNLADVPIGFAGISQAGWIVPRAAHKTNKASFMVVWSGPVCKVSQEDIYSIYTRDADTETPPAFQTVLESRTEAYHWPKFLGRDTDSREDLDGQSIPSFWIYGSRDGSIPVDLSVRHLSQLKETGHPIDYRIFPGLGHNNIIGTFESVVEWVRGLPSR